MSEPATRDDVKRVEESVSTAHRRIDKLHGEFSTMRADVHEIKGAVAPMSSNLQKITDEILERGLNVPVIQNNSTDKLLDVVKTMIYVVGIGGAIMVAGFYGLKTDAKHGDTEIHVERPDR